MPQNFPSEMYYLSSCEMGIWYHLKYVSKSYYLWPITLTLQKKKVYVHGMSLLMAKGKISPLILLFLDRVSLYLTDLDLAM